MLIRAVNHNYEIYRAFNVFLLNQLLHPTVAGLTKSRSSGRPERENR